MLPAISADLPALLLPPSNKDAGQPLKTTNGFGPPAQVELSSQQALQAQSNNPSYGLYGADGRFVESAARRELTQTTRDDTPPKADLLTDETTNNRAAHANQPPRQEVDLKQELLNAAAEVRSRSRDLSLAEFDAAVPPAAREELRALADRVDRRANTRPLESSDYRRISELLDRVGRYSDSQEALKRAEELEERYKPDPQPASETTDAAE